MTFGGFEIAQGDVLAGLRDLPDNCADGLLCDPPYGFRFMGKHWDYDVPSVDVWREALRVLKPGAALLAFGGSRTYHRIATGIEDAGFELRDCLCWLYGNGFPKSLNVSLAIDKQAGAQRHVVGTRTLTAPATEPAQQWAGYGTALKPGWEPIVLARKPLDGTVAENVTRWGVGALAIDECRIEGAYDATWIPGTRPGGFVNVGAAKGGSRPCGHQHSDGRWPANVALSHTEDCRETPNGEGCVEDCPIYLLNKHAGNRPSGKAVTRNGGGPARFFYSAKVSTREREFGCEHLPRRTGGARNHHPTLKPIALTKWLASLIKPPREDALLLVPYSGAGSEMIGALQAGWGSVLGIEGEEEYVQIARARIEAWSKAACDVS